MLQSKNLWLALLKAIVQSFIFLTLKAPIKFSNSSSTLKLDKASSKLILDTALTTSGGRVSISSDLPNPIEGNSLAFFNTTVQFGSSDSVLTGTFSALATNTLQLSGNGHLEGKHGQVLAPVLVSGQNNRITGNATFSAPIVLAGQTTELLLAQTSGLNQNIVFNLGKVILTQDLKLDPGVRLIGPGLILGNNHEIVDLSGIYTTNMTFSDGVTLELDTKLGVELRGATWSFVGPNKTSGIESDGIANLLLNQGGKIHIGPNHKLSLSNIYIQGLDNFYQNVLEIDETATLILNRSTISLLTDYAQTNGTILISGDPSRIASAYYHLTFSGSSALIVDGTVLFYDSLAQPDFNPLLFDDQLSQLILLNDGTIKSNKGQDGSNGIDANNIDTDKIISNISASLTNDMLLKSSSRLIFENQTGGWKNIFLDGQGHSIRFAQTANKYFLMDPFINLTLNNVQLEDFWPNSINRNTGTITLGDGTLIRLPRNTTLLESYKIQGTVFIEGSGCQLILDHDDAILVDKFSKLYLSGCTIVGAAGGANGGRLRSISGPAYPSTVVLANSDLWLDTNYNFSVGSMEILSNCRIHGDSKIFSWTSTGTLQIDAGSTLKMDRNLTFSYAPDPAVIFVPNPYQCSKERIHFVAPSSTLHLSGCTLHSTHTGIRLKTGHLAIENDVRFVSRGGLDEGPHGHNPPMGEEFELGKSATIEILAGSNLELIGKFKYVDL